MKIRFLLLSVVAVLLLLVCGCCRKVAPATSTEVKDSVIVKEVIRFDTVYIPGETLSFVDEHFVVIDTTDKRITPKSVTYTGKRSHVRVAVDTQGTLAVDCHCHELEKVLHLKDKEITRLRAENRTKTIVQVTHEPQWYDVMLRWAALLATIVFIFKRFINITL
jgi:hypothetical protein